ncbi:MAG: ATP-binding cassette domain-containing protein [Vicinamibacterales bacterium]
MPIVTLDHVSHAYGHVPLLDDVGLQIDPGERVSIIGRNGTGKSTLLQVVGRDLEPDAGSVWHQPGLRIGRLTQDVALQDRRRVFDVVADGLPAATADDWQQQYRVDQVLSRLQLPPDVGVATLSGGWKRRVLLARALAADPDLLLLDEPTNHLDIEATAWLEAFLADYAGAVLFVSHDRVFLQRVSTRIVELDRGHLTSWPGDYEAFLRAKDAWLSTEATQHARFDKRLAEEEAWLRQGIKARRTRDEGRVRALLAMREARAARRELTGTVRLAADTAERSGQLVLEAKDVSVSFGARRVIADASVRIMRGDRVGLIGPNGSGKTTMLRLLIGELSPDEGEVRVGSNVQVAYYDQQREQLEPERTVFDTVADGSDTVTVNGQTRHVHGYLRDFLFPAERALSPVKALSGGERNRLLLARLFTRPANLLVLDEPTNDLDIETLELLEAFLVDWQGTLLLVSHDRAFLDNVVTGTLAFEDGGRVQEYVGGYSDWLRQQAAAPGPSAKGAGRPTPTAATRRTAPVAGKLSYREQQEMERLPAEIEAMEQELGTLNGRVAAPDFYREPADTIRATLARIETLQQTIHDAYARWDALDSRVKR